MKSCVLEDKLCVACGECDRCDLDPTKTCDNCAACIETDALDYAAIPVTMPAGSKPAVTARPRRARRREKES